MDGIDAGLFAFNGRNCGTVDVLSRHYPPLLRERLFNASRSPESCGLDLLGELDHWVGECFMQAARDLVARNSLHSSRIRAIGCHGQTLRHRPRAQRPFTLQIGDPNIVAAGTGLTTVADFRRRDVALGGEGAPLAPAFHQWFLSDREEPRVVLNIGGISNITVLPAGNGIVRGFDTGPGNTLLDSWIKHCKGQAFDSSGDWGRSGEVSTELLEVFLRDEYFDLQPPKSTGFEHFNLDWVRNAVARLGASGPIRDEDIQATLTVLSARSIADAVRHHAPETARVFVCGGGVHNRFLMQCLGEHLPSVELQSTAGYGIDPQWVEAATFAWLAQRCLDGEPGNLTEVTGASAATVLGAVYFQTGTSGK